MSSEASHFAVVLERIARNALTQFSDISDERMDQFANVSAQYYSSLDKEPMTVRDALLHAIEHCALHQGHLELTRQLLGYSPAGEQ